jgi:hypothetical protein
MTERIFFITDGKLIQVGATKHGVEYFHRWLKLRPDNFDPPGRPLKLIRMVAVPSGFRGWDAVKSISDALSEYREGAFLFQHRPEVMRFIAGVNGFLVRHHPAARA